VTNEISDCLCFEENGVNGHGVRICNECLEVDTIHLCLICLTDKICMMMTRLACNRAIESLYWRMDNNSDVGLLTGYVLYLLPIELESMDLDTFSR
jgi:hypothetical protein